MTDDKLTEKSLAIMQTVYPTFTDKQMAVYCKLLGQYPGVVVSKAIGELIRTSESSYAPPVGKICGLCEKIINQSLGKTELTGADAWGEVRYVITKIGPYEAKNYRWKDRIAEEVARAIGLDTLFSMTSGTEEDVIRGQFLKMYEGKTNIARERDRVETLLADGRINEITQKISEKLQIAGGKQ